MKAFVACRQFGQEQIGVVKKQPVPDPQVKMEQMEEEMATQWQAWKMYQSFIRAQSMLMTNHSTLGWGFQIHVGYRSGIQSVCSAVELASRFENEVAQQNEIGKGTNIPKFLFSVLIPRLQHLELSRKHAKWVRSYVLKYKNNKNRCCSRFSLMQLLSQGIGEGQQKAEWKARHRQQLMNLLQNHRVQLILQNTFIPPENKVHYLFFCRMYEWRLNNQSLLGHLK